MSLDSDVVLLGSGAAPLVAAVQFLSLGYRVLLLNPDSDFFLEDSELSLDPFWPLSRQVFTSRRLQSNVPEAAIAALRPSFPGAVESWAEGSNPAGFHDTSAPHVRQRGRLFVSGPEVSPDDWDFMEELYLRAEDQDLQPQMLEGLQCMARFPGFSKSRGENQRGLLLKNSCDYDVTSYRNGILEFVRERLGPERVVCGAGQVELMPGGVRFSVDSRHHTARAGQGLLVFWTPRLTQWVLAQAKEREAALPLPLGVRVWEQWSLVSRDPLNPLVIGNLRNMTVWADIEGAPSARGVNRMSALLAGPLMGLQAVVSREHGLSWADSDSFDQLHALCCEFLGWNRFSVRLMRPRAILEWGPPAREGDVAFALTEDPRVLVVPGCDGPLVDVVGRARAACERLQQLEVAPEGDPRWSPAGDPR